MYLTLMKAALAILVAVALVACGREETGSAIPAEAVKDAAGAGARKAGTPEDAAKPADPLKEGY